MNLGAPLAKVLKIGNYVIKRAGRKWGQSLSICWNARVVPINLNELSSFQYRLNCPHLNITRVRKDRVIQADIIKLDNEKAWTSPTTRLGRKMTHHKPLFWHIAGFIIRSVIWIHIYLMHSIVWSGSLGSRDISKNLISRYAHKCMKEWNCRLCHRGSHRKNTIYVCHSGVRPSALLLSREMCHQRINAFFARCA